MTSRAKSLLRRNLRYFFRNYYFRGCGLLVDLLDPILRSATVEVASVNGVPFRFDFSLDPNIIKMYYGIYETDEVRFIRDHLSSGETFIDIGANIGYLSAVAASIVGSTGVVHSFEPVPEYFDQLSDLAILASAKGFNIVANQYAVGEKEGTIQIQVGKSNIGWSTIVPGLMPNSHLKCTIKVPIIRLDDYIASKKVENISLIKIDVEGAEQLVLRGLSSFFLEHKPIILCEVCVSANELLDSNVRELFSLMKSFGYKAYNLRGSQLKPLQYTDLIGTSNVVWK